MKKLLILPVAAMLFACAGETKETKINYAVLSGTFDNLADGKVSLYDYTNSPENIEVLENGTFTDTITMDSPGYYTLRVGRSGYQVFLTPGENLNISKDVAVKDQKPTFTGATATANAFLLHKAELTQNGIGQMEVLFAKEEADFIASLDDLKGQQLAALEATTASAEFKALETKALDFEKAERMMMYPNYHPYFAKKQEFEVSDTFLNDVKAIDMDNDENAALYGSYRNLLNMNYNEELNNSKSGDMVTIADALNTIKTKKGSKIRDVLVLNSLYFFDSNTADLVGTRDALLAQTTGDKLRTMISDKYEKIKNLVKGKPSPTFNYENYKGGTTALEEFKGKYVYIDVWATWCGPCIGEIPSLQKMEHDFEGKNVEFVSISIDEKPAYETWRKMIADKELGGSQLMSDNAWKSKFVEDYAIEGIPRFILLDPEGNIVSADAARPSNPKLAETFNELGIK